MSDWDVSKIVLNKAGGNDTVVGTAEMVVDEDDSHCVLAHPLKLGYVHLVVVSKKNTDGGKELCDDSASIIRDLQDKAFEMVRTYSQPIKSKQLLSKKKGLSKTPSNRWTGIDEIRDFSKTYSTAKLIPFSMGFLGFDPEAHYLQLHIVSKDFTYIKSRTMWNMYTTSWGLLTAPTILEMITSGFGVTLPDYPTLVQKCKNSPYTCYVTSEEYESLSDVKQASLVAQLGTTISASVKEQKRPLPQSESIKKPKPDDDEAPAEQAIVKPPKPSMKVKPCKESITSAFLKWSEYYFRLLKANVPPEDEDLAFALQQMKDLRNHTALTQIDQSGMHYLQKQAREKVYGKVIETDSKGNQKRNMEWDGTEFTVKSGETEIDIGRDEERVPY
eukprot:TRINITY_DN17484_c0_g1_i2.p1 TRINITY_DN17484_c0_g1~~TRINITY_DN17484_c0_g1_i2.p1  ORF type:complete len:387 (+),score=60.09 TRINITY_DN17484_c0_g1_i2:54-1214(+)